MERFENGSIVASILKFSQSSPVFSDSGNESTVELTLNSSLVLSATGQSRRQDVQKQTISAPARTAALCSG